MGGQKSDNKILWFHYKFRFSDDKVKEFRIELDSQTLDLIPKERSSYPEWTRLSYRQCPNCPLKESEHPRCPIAANLVDVVDYFKDSLSYDEADTEIATQARTYKKQSSLQHGVSSLIGIYMVTSGCPIMDKLKPMVRTHLPFATLEETLYRVISMYLMAQYFLHKSGREPDWELKNLVKLYEDIRTVNQSFWKRIADIHIEDAVLNAVIHLDCYARFVKLSLLEKGVSEIEEIFRAYF